MSRDNRLPLAHLGVAVAAFGVAACMALMQALSRANLDLPFRSAQIYYLSVTAHGTLMALVFTTFFIMGLGYALTPRALGRPLLHPRLAWASFWVALVGTLATVAAILSGNASVLYTFYPPLKAHPAFYIGATLLVIGSWGWGFVVLRTLRAWRREHAGVPIPLAVHGMATTIIVWYIATAGVAAEMLLLLIPWSLGIEKTIDPELARTLFWWFGHPLVYFWLLPAYVIWYTVLPRAAGGKLFSDNLARLVFVLFIVLSSPVGLHHQAMDPGIPAGWKLFHAFNTMWILFPSFVTAFTVIASLEVAGRMKGATGLFNWIGKLPWGDPLVASVLLAMLLFAFGGFGGAINAAYGMNAMVHNTAWVQGHFHLTVGSAAALTFMGATYWLLPKLTGRDLELGLLAKVQPYLWFVGMMLFSFSNHITGLMGMPRRVFDPSYGGDALAAKWRTLTGVSAIGGLLLFVSAAFFVMVVLGTWLAGRKKEQPAVEFAEPLAPAPPRLAVLDRLGLWTVVAVVLVLVAYAYPIWHLISMPHFGSPPFAP
jgi:cytochrome c oxidase subunit 1